MIIFLAYAQSSLVILQCMPHEDKSVFVLLVFLMREMLHNLLEVLNKPLLTEAKTQQPQ